MRRKFVGVAVVVSVAGLAQTVGAGIDFRVIDRLADGTLITDVSTSAVCNNGDMVVGTALVAGTWRGFSWSPTSGATLLPLGESGFISEASDVNADGAVIVGTSGAVPMAWRSGQPDELEHLPDQTGVYAVRRISADGRIAIGTVGSFAVGYRGLVWHDGKQVDMPNGMTNATALSANGDYLFGYGEDSAGNEGVGRAVLNGKFELITAGTAEISDVSYDGSIAVGTIANEFGGAAATRWDSLGASHSLFEGDSWSSSAAGVSADGTFIVGNHELLGGFLWSESTGAVAITDLLIAAGAELDGWTGLGVVGISADGNTLTGTIVNPQGKYVGWTVTIPTPASAAVLGMGLLAATRRRR